MAGGEEFGLAGFVVGRDAAAFAVFVTEGHMDVVEGFVWVAGEQVQAGSGDEQVDVVHAIAAVAGDFQAGFEGAASFFFTLPLGESASQGR